MAKNIIEEFTQERAVVFDRRLITGNYYDCAREEFIPQTLEEHRARCAFVRKRILLSAGLEPALELPAFSPVLGEKKDFRDIEICSVFIDSLPGLKLTGSLFMPKNRKSLLPGVLCPHGHWVNGRVHHDQRGGVVKRCCEMARLGFAVFAYDMVGFNDCNDLPHYVNRWPQNLKATADTAGISTFGLQTVNSMRALDFITSLPEVDAGRIACTGASGGGSQTWFIAALDDRIRAAAPVCMLSSHFQGGCACEEGPLLRTTGLTSFDIVSAIAPRPLLLPAVTGDWTNLNPVYEVPRMKQVYRLYHAEDKVENFYFEDQHNYNQRTREHVYAWLVKQLMGDDRGKTIAEEEYDVPAPEMLWLNGEKPAAPDEKSIADAFTKLKEVYSCGVLDTRGSLENWQNKTREHLRDLLENTEPPVRNVVTRAGVTYELPEAKAYAFFMSRREVKDWVFAIDVTGNAAVEAEEHIVFALPGTWQEYLEDTAESGLVNACIARNRALRMVELLGSGIQKNQLERAIRNAPDQTAAFDQPYFTMRVYDILSAAVALQEKGCKKIRIASEGNAVPAALAAAALLRLPVTVDLQNMDEDVWNDPVNFQPLIGRLGGLAGLLQLNIGNGSIFCRPSGSIGSRLKQQQAQISAEPLAAVL